MAGRQARDQISEAFCRAAKVKLRFITQLESGLGVGLELGSGLELGLGLGSGNRMLTILINR